MSEDMLHGMKLLLIDQGISSSEAAVQARALGAKELTRLLEIWDLAKEWDRSEK